MTEFSFLGKVFRKIYVLLGVLKMALSMHPAVSVVLGRSKRKKCSEV